MASCSSPRKIDFPSFLFMSLVLRLFLPSCSDFLLSPISPSFDLRSFSQLHQRMLSPLFSRKKKKSPQQHPSFRVLEHREAILPPYLWSCVTHTHRVIIYARYKDMEGRKRERKPEKVHHRYDLPAFSGGEGRRKVKRKITPCQSVPSKAPFAHM